MLDSSSRAGQLLQLAGHLGQLGEDRRRAWLLGVELDPEVAHPEAAHQQGTQTRPSMPRSSLAGTTTGRTAVAIPCESCQALTSTGTRLLSRKFTRTRSACDWLEL